MTDEIREMREAKRYNMPAELDADGSDSIVPIDAAAIGQLFSLPMVLAAPFDTAQKVIAELVGALKWYAGPEVYSNAELDEANGNGWFFPYGLEDTPIADDMGKRARELLVRLGEGE